MLARQKDQMVAALWSNSNWDDNKNTRQSAIEQLESQYDEAVAEIKASGSTQSREQEIDKDNPFFAATERGLAKVEQKMGYSPSSKNNEEEIDYMKGLDQE